MSIYSHFYVLVVAFYWNGDFEILFDPIYINSLFMINYLKNPKSMTENFFPDGDCCQENGDKLPDQESGKTFHAIGLH